MEALWVGTGIGMFFFLLLAGCALLAWAMGDSKHR